MMQFSKHHRISLLTLILLPTAPTNAVGTIKKEEKQIKRLLKQVQHNTLLLDFSHLKEKDHIEKTLKNKQSEKVLLETYLNRKSIDKNKQTYAKKGVDTLQHQCTVLENLIVILDKKKIENENSEVKKIHEQDYPSINFSDASDNETDYTYLWSD